MESASAAGIRTDWDRHEVCLAIAGSGPGDATYFLIADGLADDDGRGEMIDDSRCIVFATTEHFFRLVPARPNRASGSKFMVYDRNGVVLYRRLDNVADPHSVSWTGRHLIVPNTYYNRIDWLTPDGSIARTWQAPGPGGDTWHINGVEVHDGHVVATAFGRFTNREDPRSPKSQNQGVLFDLTAERDLVTNLSCPHDPRFVDGGWLICDSHRHRLIHVDPETGRLNWTVDFGKWTRGIGIVRDRIYVGLSEIRHGTNTKLGAIAILNRQTLEVIRILGLPFMEVNSLCVVPRALAEGVKRERPAFAG